jgi:hypothetical protein
MASETHIFFTYAFLRENGTPYYIGKGCNNRHLIKSGRAIAPPRDLTRILILKENLSEAEAFDHEKYMIFIFGRKDKNTGVLHNKTDGGEGCSGTVYSPESRKRMSQKRRLRVTKQSTRDKQSRAMTGRTLSAETRQKLSRSLKGRIRDPQHCQAISAARKRDWQNPEYRDKIIAGLKQFYQNRTLTDTEIQRRREATRGKKWYWNPETGHTIRLAPESVIPPGYTPGRKTFKRSKKS